MQACTQLLRGIFINYCLIKNPLRQRGMVQLNRNSDYVSGKNTQCIKITETMHQSTKTDAALSCIYLFPVEYEIDKRKYLLFIFGHLY